MQKRFNPNCKNFDEIVEYMIKRARQMLFMNIRLVEVVEHDFGGVGHFVDESDEDEHVKLVAPYILKSFRYEGRYTRYIRENGYPLVLTSTDCDIEKYLFNKNIANKCIGFDYIDGYETVSEYYGDKKAARSGIDYMNHIDEGMAILTWLGYDINYHGHESVFGAYNVHPLFQMDEDLLANKGNLSDLNKEAILFTMEYRNIANAYLSKRKIEYLAQIQLSPLEEVNDMLKADKIQNRKDFELYHKGRHNRSEELQEYFRNWFDRLGITEDFYQECVAKLLIEPKITRLP